MLGFLSSPPQPNNPEDNTINPVAKLLAGKFENLTELDLRFACLSRNPTGKYVNINFLFYTNSDRLHASIRYNKKFGTFIGYLTYDFRGYLSSWEPVTGTAAGFFTFQEAYIHVANQILLTHNLLPK